MTKRYVVSYTAYEDGRVTNAGSFSTAYETHEKASIEMHSDFVVSKDQIKGLSEYENKFDYSVTTDDVDGKELDVLCVIRDWNGEDYNIYTWTVWPVWF